MGLVPVVGVVLERLAVLVVVAVGLQASGATGSQVRCLLRATTCKTTEQFRLLIPIRGLGCAGRVCPVSARYVQVYEGKVSNRTCPCHAYRRDLTDLDSTLGLMSFRVALGRSCGVDAAKLRGVCWDFALRADSIQRRNTSHYLRQRRALIAPCCATLCRLVAEAPGVLLFYC